MGWDGMGTGEKMKVNDFGKSIIASKIGSDHPSRRNFGHRCDAGSRLLGSCATREELKVQRYL
jgi:hypothetical protein